MESRYLYYNIADTLHARELKKTIHHNVMTEDQADGVEAFLNSMKEGTALEGDLPIRIVCVQGDAGTGKTQSIVSLCSMLQCPIVVGSTNPCSVNVAERCRSAYPYSSATLPQLSGTAWTALNWNIQSEQIGGKSEREINNIYAQCMKTRNAPTKEQNKQIYKLLNKMLFTQIRKKFQDTSEKDPQKKIYTMWNNARLGSTMKGRPQKVHNEKAMQQLYEMFCSVPQEEITQEEFNEALGFCHQTGFDKHLPRPLLSNFWIIEEAARLPAYFTRIIAYYHYMVRFHLKPPGYRNTMLTIYLVGSPLQSRIIGFKDFSVMDEAVLDADKRNTHVSIYTVNRRTIGNTLKATALANVVHVLESDCPLQTEHCRLLDPFVMPEDSFMDPKVAPSAMRLTAYHDRVIEFTNKANKFEDDIVTFDELLFVSEGVRPKVDGTHKEIIKFLQTRGPQCMPYRCTRAKDIRNESVSQLAQPLVGKWPQGQTTSPITYTAYSMRRTLGKNTPVTIQHTTRLTPIEFFGTYRSFHNLDTLSHSCAEQLWSLRIDISFADMLCGILSHDDSCCLPLVVDEVWIQAYTYAQHLFRCGLDNIEQQASIAAGITEAQDILWDAAVKADNIGFMDKELRVQPFTGEAPHYFQTVIIRGDRFPNTLTLEDAIELPPSVIKPDTHSLRKHIPRSDTTRQLLCESLLENLYREVSNGRIHLNDLLLRTPSGVLFKTVNLLIHDRWSAVFPKTRFVWHSLIVEDEDDNNMEPKKKKAKKETKENEMHPKQMVNGNEEKNKQPPSNAERETEYAHMDCDSGDEDELEDNMGKEEASSIFHMLHTVYDSRGRTIDSVQGDTIKCSTFVDMEFIRTMGQLTVALTRNTDPGLLMLTSNNITRIPPRDLITRFVRLSARDTKYCYYVK